MKIKFSSLENQLLLQLSKRSQQNRLRNLEPSKDSLVDFWSNDYLGLSQNQDLLQFVKHSLLQSTDFRLGATGSRLISGNYALLQNLEALLADTMQASSATFFPSTYLANLALLGNLAARHDTYIIDASCHASIKEGVRLSQAKKISFEHNQVDHLRAKLKLAEGQPFVVTESLFSMEGDFAPLKDILAVCKEFGAILIVDEAHAAGLFGAGGSGLVEAEQLIRPDVIRMVGFGKAFGQAGGVVLGPEMLKPWFANFGLPFIYTTAPSPVQVEVLLHTLNWLKPILHELQKNFQEKVLAFNQQFSAIAKPTAHSPIQRVILESEHKATYVALQLKRKGIGAKAILPPTVPDGQQQLRFTWHLFNTLEEMELLVSLLRE